MKAEHIGKTILTVTLTLLVLGALTAGFGNGFQIVLFQQVAPFFGFCGAFMLAMTFVYYLVWDF